MSFSDEHIPPAPSFLGDETGEIFAHDEPAVTTPEINERVVNTQSGFLVVVKKLQERIALSVKRRLGTPPSSSVLLTPDESLSLSKILAASISSDEFNFGKTANEQTVSARYKRNKRANYNNVASGQQRSNILKSSWTLLSLLVALALCLFTAVYFTDGRTMKKAASFINGDLLADSRVEEFSKQYVTNLLDFNPNSYRQSQIKAMSNMSSELLDKYWQETNFPLNKEQLKTLPEINSLDLVKVKANRLDKNTSEADVYAELGFVNKKKHSSVHLKLKISPQDNGQLCVAAQEDLVAGSL